MKTYHCAAAIAAALAFTTAAPSFAQPQAVGTEPGAAMLALVTVPAKTGATLKVSSPAFAAGGDIPFENTSYRANIFPGLSWTAGPKGTKSYAVIMQDDDAVFRGGPILHWTMYDVPAGMTKLAAGMTTPPAGASFGPNIRGPNQAYMGPHTPPGPKHHYHLQIFALDTVLGPQPITNYDVLVGPMKGHVLASGELVGLGRADPDAPPSAPRPPPPAN